MADSKGARAMRHPIWDTRAPPRVEEEELVQYRKCPRDDQVSDDQGNGKQEKLSGIGWHQKFHLHRQATAI